MNRLLLEKYNVPVPRYTSYPPANFFRPEVGSADLLSYIEESNADTPRHLSFYIHFPYCSSLCHYCGCNSYLRRHGADDETYIEGVLREIDIVTDRLDRSRSISQIHFGGGTPSGTQPRLLARIIERLTARFGCIDAPEIAIECHPGYLRLQDYTELLAIGFNRLSLGVQDFEPTVLRTAGRKPSLERMSDVRSLLRAHGVPVNFDFIYGLPGQTPDSFETTIATALTLEPDRLVTFSYAHVPQMFPRQMVLERAGLPSSADKDMMYARAQARLLDHGYGQIGLDHFVRSTDELYHAALEQRLHRNFQGYCTRRTTGQVYAFGVSAISQLTRAYAQNTKEIDQYLQCTVQGVLPVARGYRLSQQEQIVREVITTLMCNESLSWSSIADHIGAGCTPSDVRQATAYDATEMAALEQDGVVRLYDDGLQMVEKGSPLLRYVASRLDPLMDKQHSGYSKPV